MRYRRIIVSIALLALTTVTGLAQALSERYNRQRPVIVVCDWDKPPYEFLNDQGDPTGSNIFPMDMARPRKRNLKSKIIRVIAGNPRTKTARFTPMTAAFLS